MSVSLGGLFRGWLGLRVSMDMAALETVQVNRVIFAARGPGFAIRARVEA